MGFTTLETGNANWQSITFTPPATVVKDEEYTLAVSDTINNNNDLNNLDAFVQIEQSIPGEAVPKPTGGFTDPSYRLIVYIEEQVIPGVWRAIAESFGQPLNRNPDSGRGIEVSFVIQTANPSDQGQPFNVTNGFKYFVNENPSENIRVRIACIENDPGGPAALQSVTLSGAIRLY